MTPQDLIPLGFFLLGLPAIALILYGRASRNAPPRHPRALLAGVALLGLTLLWTNGLSLYFTKTSARPSLTGTITNLQQHHGKGAYSNFTLVPPTGQSQSIHADSTSSNFTEDAQAQVTYLAYNHSLLTLTLLTGPHQGWHLEESDGTASGLFLAAIGLLILMGTAIKYHQDNSTEIL